MPLTLEDAYKALGLNSSASEQEVKTAYKKLALLNHPDKAKPEDRDEAHKRFLLISESYKRITDPDSFKDEEENEPSEEEMQAMFFSMFSDMMGGFGGGGFGGSGFSSRGAQGAGIPVEILEALMMQEMTSGGMGGFTFAEDDSEDDEGGFNPFMMGGGMMGMEAFLSMMVEEEDPRRNRSHHHRRGAPHHGHGHGHKSHGNKKQPPPPKKPQAKAAPTSEMPADNEDWETDEEENKKPTRGNNAARGNLGRRPMYFEEDDEDDDEDEDLDMDEEALLYMMLNGMAGGRAGGINDLYGFGGMPGRSSQGRTPGSKAKKNAKKRAKAKAKKAASKTGTDFSPAKDSEKQQQQPIPAEAKAALSGSSGSARSAGNSVPDFPSSSSAKKAAAPPAADAKKAKKTGNLEIGDRVLVFNRHLGSVMFVGDVHYAKGTFAGVVMDDPAVGKNNGTIRGVKYFECNGRNSGLMVALSDLSRA